MANENMFADIIPKQSAEANIFADLIPQSESQYYHAMGENPQAKNFPNVKEEPGILPIETTYNPDGTVDSSRIDIKAPFRHLATGVGDLYQQAENRSTDTTPEAVNAMMALASFPSVAKTAAGALGDIGERAATSLRGPAGNFPKPIATPPVDPRIAGLVQDASNLGINIPTRVFHPGIASDALTKAGLMSGDTMKADVTTALSKVMGHEGTPNLDVDTMNGIQKNIGQKMDSFALKADENGGIPVSKTATNSIGDESLADEPKVNKLIQKIHDRVDENGNLSGADYQALTKKGGVLDRAMNSTDSEFADTAQKLRAHLDDQLEQSVHPDDLEDFKNTRRQYRTMKIVQPIVESGGVTGQADSASKLFGAVSRNYGGISNALKYNPELGKIAQIVNEFPEAVKDSAKPSLLAKVGTLATAPAALGVGAVGGVPAGVAAAAALPIAKGTAMYLGSAGRKAALLAKSLPEVEAPIVKFGKRPDVIAYAKGGPVRKNLTAEFLAARRRA